MHLFVYGSLVPGGEHHDKLASVPGAWERATVQGTVIADGPDGYPVLIPDGGATVEGYVFTAPGLANHWARLDDFEGAAYRRTMIDARTASGETVRAHVYVLRETA